MCETAALLISIERLMLISSSGVWLSWWWFSFLTPHLFTHDQLQATDHTSTLRHDFSKSRSLIITWNEILYLYSLFCTPPRTSFFPCFSYTALYSEAYSFAFNRWRSPHSTTSSPFSNTIYIIIPSQNPQSAPYFLKKTKVSCVLFSSVHLLYSSLD